MVHPDVPQLLVELTCQISHSAEHELELASAPDSTNQLLRQLMRKLRLQQVCVVNQHAASGTLDRQSPGNSAAHTLSEAKQGSTTDCSNLGRGKQEDHGQQTQPCTASAHCRST